MKQWPHAPLHLPTGNGSYIVTAGTYMKQHFFRKRYAIDLLEECMLRMAETHGCELMAWAIFPNHYHWVGYSPEGATAVRSFAQHLHSETARLLNEREGTVGRKIWHQFWDTELRNTRSYFARLNYVMLNAVKHGLVTDPEAYPWCSAGWFGRSFDPARVKTVRSFKTDLVRVHDDFDAVLPE